MHKLDFGLPNLPGSDQREIRRADDPLVPTVFHEPWWLNAASGGNYEQVEVSDGHRVVGRFPYAFRRQFGRNISVHPAHTHILGPAVNEGSGTTNTRFLKRYSVTRELIEKLPKFHRFRQKLHRGYPEALSFQSKGFRVGVQFTFEVSPLTQMEAWNSLRNKTRNVIRRAMEELEVIEINDPAEFVSFYQHNLAGCGRTLNSPGILQAVCGTALEKNAGKIWCARDKKRRPVAAIFVPFDNTTAYYLKSTRATDSGNGAISLLIWTGISFCSERRRVFNFDGVGAEGAVLLYAGFGGQPRPTYIATRESRRMKAIDFFRRLPHLFAGENLFDRY